MKQERLIDLREGMMRTDEAGVPFVPVVAALATVQPAWPWPATAREVA